MLVIRNSECKGKEKALEKIRLNRVQEESGIVGVNKVNTALSYTAQYCHSEGFKNPKNLLER